MIINFDSLHDGTIDRYTQQGKKKPSNWKVWLENCSDEEVTNQTAELMIPEDSVLC